MGKQQLYAILGNALSEFSDTTIDFDALVLIYGDKPLAEAVRQYLIDYNGTSYDEEYVAFMISLLADNIGGLLNSKVSQVLTAENIPELPFDYAQLVAAVGKYGKDVGFTFTLDANDNLIAFDVTYLASVTGSDGITTTAEIFSASWKEGDEVPQISFDYDGAVASVEESEDGEITVSVSLMGTEHVAMLISKSQEGLQLSVTVNSADGGKRLVDLSAEYISDGEDGAEVTATCTVCGYSYTYYKQGHEMTTVEEHRIATQCGADTKISVSRCSVCGYELISDNMTSPHVAYPKYPDIISSEQYVSEYDKYYSERYEQYDQSYMAQGYSAGEAKAAAEEEASAAATKYMDENFVDIGKIEELGADTDGFSYGTAWIRTCQVCGLTLSKYTYHANASEKSRTAIFSP